MRLFRYALKNKFILRIVAFFSAVVVLSLAAIILFSNRYLSQKAESDSESANIRAVSMLQNYMTEKNMIVKHLLQQLYSYQYYRELLNAVESLSDSRSESGNYLNLVSQYMKLGMFSDNNIVSIELVSTQTSRMFFTSGSDTELGFLDDKTSRRLESYSQKLKTYGTNIFPAYIDTTLPYSRYLLPVECSIKDSNLTRDLGYLLLEFDCANIDAQFADYFKNYPGAKLFVLSASGHVIYDSARQMVDKIYPDFGKIQSGSSGSYQLTLSTHVEQLYDDDLSMYFVSTLPMSDLYARVSGEKNGINIFIAFCILLDLVATGLFSMFYSRRVTRLCQTINVIRAGDLSARVPKSKVNDEISLISENLNDMCDMLQQYIQRIYISEIQSRENDLIRKDAELKQKSSELYALQAQINPHFLYNALESIRMRALSLGNRDVAKMTYILSTLFRQSLKKDLIISIADEIDNCKLYLDFSKLRYPEKLDIRFDVTDETLECGIIRHILQPIIENSVNHGIDLTKAVCRILIVVQCVDGQLILQVKDNGKGIEPAKLAALQRDLLENTSTGSNKIGILNVNQRIRMMFGDSYGLTVESDPGWGTVSTIRVPAFKTKELGSYVQRFYRG